MTASKIYDVIIVGGSYAGLSAAMALGRSMRRVLIIDSGLPCNRQTPHSHNLITHDGATPQEIAAKARAQVLNYPTVNLHQGVAIRGKKGQAGFTITTQAGAEFEGRKLIFATGIQDLLPAIRGFSECWGISVIHCPYCHGYEFRGQKTGIMAPAEKAQHLTPLINNLTGSLRIFPTGPAEFSADQLTRLEQHSIEVIEKEIVEIVHEQGRLRRVILDDGSDVQLDALYASVPFRQHTDLPAALGCQLNEQGYIQVNDFQQTTVPDVFACGDNSSPMRSVASAIAKGNFVGAVVNKELADADFWSN